MAARRPPSKMPPSGAKRGKGRPCLACNHGQRDEIDHCIATNGKLRELTARFGLTKSCLDRHKRHVLAPGAATASIVAAQAAYEPAVQSRTAQAILTRVADADRALQGAEGDRDWGAMVRAISEVRSIHMDVAKLTGELKTSPTVEVNLTAAPEWLAIRSRMVELVRARPELREIMAWVVKGQGAMP